MGRGIGRQVPEARSGPVSLLNCHREVREPPFRCRRRASRLSNHAFGHGVFLQHEGRCRTHSVQSLIDRQD